MPLISPYAARPAETPPVQRPRDGVVPVSAVDATQDRAARDRRDRRRRLLQQLAEEAEGIADLSLDDRDAVRRNFLGHLRTRLRERHREPAEDAAFPPPPDRLLDLGLPPRAGMEQAAETARLEGEMRRCLALHTERAERIARYVHALQAADPLQHALDIDA